MFKAIKDNKIIAVSDTDSDFFCIVKDAVETDDAHVCEDYGQYNGEYLLKSEIPMPGRDEQSEKRAMAYRDEIDPITAHISRLRDENQSAEIIAEISDLITERARKVAEIKERYPY